MFQCVAGAQLSIQKSFRPCENSLPDFPLKPGEYLPSAWDREGYDSLGFGIVEKPFHCTTFGNLAGDHFKNVPKCARHAASAAIKPLNPTIFRARLRL